MALRTRRHASPRGLAGFRPRVDRSCAHTSSTESNDGARERRCRDSLVGVASGRGAGLWSREQIGDKRLAEDRQPLQPRERVRSDEQFEQGGGGVRGGLSANDGSENGLLRALVAEIVRDERAEGESD